jgi:hypothetical protein
MLTAQGFALPQVVLGFSAGYDDILDTNWGGANVWISLDDVNYQLIGQMSKPSTIGSTTANIAGYSGSNPDNSQTLTVNLSECDGILASVSSSLAAAGYSICCISDVSGFEIIGYTTATLVSGNTYTLSGLYRGLYGTTSRFFGAGSQFLYVGMDSNIFETNLPSSYVGMIIYVKLQSFNVFNSTVQDLSDCVAYQWLATSPTPVGPIPPPTIAATYRRIVYPTLPTTVRVKSTRSRIRT